MPDDVLNTLTEVYNGLTRSGKKVANYIFQNPTEAQYMSITVLAEECNVAEATISRFCQTLGFLSYSNFKLALAKRLGASAANLPTEDGEAGLMEKISQEDSFSDMCKKLYAADVSAVQQTLALMDEEAVARAVRYLSDAQRVYCFGQGGSLVMAMEAWARFLTVAPQFQCVEDAHMQAMTAGLCGASDVFLFVSYSGATKDMMDVLRLARSRGAKVVLITHFAKSPASVYADVILLCGSKEGPLQSGSIAAKMGLLFVIDVLYQEYCRKNLEFTDRNREATAEAVADKLL